MGGKEKEEEEEVHLERKKNGSWFMLCCCCWNRRYLSTYVRTFPYIMQMASIPRNINITIHHPEPTTRLSVAHFKKDGHFVQLSKQTKAELRYWQLYYTKSSPIVDVVLGKVLSSVYILSKQASNVTNCPFFDHD